MKKLNELNLMEALEGLKSGEFTSLQLVTACLEQIERVDSEIKAYVLVLKEAALNQAERADLLIKENGVEIFKKQPLLGIPYACKDNFSTEGIKTTASSNVLKDYIPPFESTVTKRLKDAGAILIGKTNMDAFAHGSSTETSDFFPTSNPWDIKRIPGGSSGGSAAAVASNTCTFAIGSETAGSIRGPAGWCGITGLKPTYGRVSRYGVVAMASSTDSPGPMTKVVSDAALVLEIISGKDQNDATTSFEAVGKYLEFTNSSDIKGMRLGLPKSYFEIEFEPEIKEVVLKQIEKLKELGAEIIEMDLLAPKYSIGVYTILQRSEVSSNLARFDGIRYGNDRTAFGAEAKKRMMLGAYTLSSGYYDAYYSKAQKVRTLIVEDFKKNFKDVDVIVAPVMPCVAPEFGVSEKSAAYGELIDLLQEPSAIAGLCGISVPCGFVKQLPVGIQFIGNLFEEEKILKVSSVYQNSTVFHKEFPVMKGAK